jgi:O-antigen biosynthesis protein
MRALLDRRRLADRADLGGSPEDGFCDRPSVRGKSIYVGEQRLQIRGVTYGTFRPRGAADEQFPSPLEVADDFARMAAAGVNAVRTYTVPPDWLLDLALEHGHRVIVGLPWEQHVTFLDESARAEAICRRVREGVRACRRHPAVLCYAVGNEIPSSIVRWHGPRRIERFLHRLARTVRDEDPGALVTYVNYPSTEYLRLAFADLICFNVFLESTPAFESYLARLQNLAGDRPLVVTELGLDSRRNGTEEQAAALERQLRTAFDVGCAGAVVFSWTDEWHRGGFDVLDWDFGLVDRARQPKPALAAVANAFSDQQTPSPDESPAVSVVVCTHNGERWLRGCLAALARVEYPNYEVIIVNDGSTDATERIAAEFPHFRLISTPGVGLSSARNLGLDAATGEIVAYLDDDARPDPSWLRQLTRTLVAGGHAAVGGPNIPPPDDGPIADCVANSPGGPVHVLLSDTVAEHVPGCNMAFRKTALEAIGGFDPRFHVAGDDVDVCWRLQNGGEAVGFSPGAVVYHHRRPSVRGYLRQQFQYGKAEALLEQKWPQRYNRAGHLKWAGLVYGNCLSTALKWRRGKIRYGSWGTALFQSIHRTPPGLLASLPLTPEWYLVLASLGTLCALGALWRPLLLALPLLAVAGGAMLLEAASAAAHATFTHRSRSRVLNLGLRGLTGALHLLQPLARLAGRLRYGLTPWRRRGARTFALPRPSTSSSWSVQWRAPHAWLESLEGRLRRLAPVTTRGGDYDRWDLQVRGGTLGVARVRMGVEEHGSGCQLIRLRKWPVPSRVAVVGSLLFGGLAVASAGDGAALAAAALAGLAVATTLWTVHDCAVAAGAFRRALERQVEETPGQIALTPATARAPGRESRQVMFPRPARRLPPAHPLPIAARRADEA